MVLCRKPIKNLCVRGGGMDTRVECPYCGYVETIDLEKYQISLNDFRHNPRVENLPHICGMCSEQYTFDVEVEISTISFTDEYLN